MRSILTRLSNFFLITVFLFVLSFAFPVHADDAAPAMELPSFMKDIKNGSDFENLTPEQKKAYSDFIASQPSGKAVTVATVNVHDIKILVQQDNLFDISFGISNDEGVQSGIIYAIDLLKKDDNGNVSLVDQKIYSEDILTLGQGETTQKLVSYVAPRSLQGQYFIAVEARNSEGLMFGMPLAEEPIMLNGSGDRIAVEQSTCFLTVDGETEDKRYALEQKMDISSEQNLILHCSLANNFTTERIVTPTIEVRYRSAFGRLISQNSQDSIVLVPGKNHDFSIKIPKATNPQLYAVSLTFLDENHEQISSPIGFSYVSQGPGASIQNIVIDKNAYSKGDVAQITLYWTGTAESSSLSVSVTDEYGNACIDPFTQALDAKKSQGGVEHFSLTVIRDCQRPIIVAKILDQDGKILTGNDSFLQSRNRQEEGVLAPILSAQGNPFMAIIYGLVFLSIITALIYLIRKNRRAGMTLFFSLVMGAGIFGSGKSASAVTFYVSDGVGDSASFTATLNKSSYAPGENIVASGSYVPLSTSHYGTNTAFRLDATIAGVYKSILNTSASFASPGAVGSYSAQILGGVGVRFNDPCAACIKVLYLGSVNTPIPYTIAAPNAPPTAPTITGSQAVNTNVSMTYGFKSTDPEGKLLRYYVNWGDGTPGTWSGYLPSGTPLNLSHTWVSTGSKTITAYAQDQGPALSPATTYSVQVNNIINGVCGSTNNVCAQGALVDIADLPASYQWNCNGLYGGSNAPTTCSACKVVDSSWTPALSSVCSSTSVMQTSNCGTQRTMPGTATNVWTPADLSNVCSSATVTQTNRCTGAQRIVNGTKVCSLDGWQEVAP